MHERNLGDTKLRLTEITLGTWGLSGAYGPMVDSLVSGTVEAALETGITSFDVAPLWGDMEKRLGELLAESEIETQLITRGGVVLEDGEVRQRYDADSLKADLERSQERLQRDTLDIWLLHEPTLEALEASEPFETAQAFVEDDAVRQWGVSTAIPEVAEKAIEAGAKAICVPHHIFASDLVEDLREAIEGAGVGVLARSPLCHGLLTGRWTEYRRFATEDHRNERWTPQSLAIRVRQVAALRFLVKEQVKSMTSAALRFALDHPVVTTAILGARRPAQVRGLDSLVGQPPYMEEPDRIRLAQVLAASGA
jgi:aryl-alcohol dehydrogenase-like predicted oxidoreductase